jgi:hypothetical protein
MVLADLEQAPQLFERARLRAEVLEVLDDERARLFTESGQEPAPDGAEKQEQTKGQGEPSGAYDRSPSHSHILIGDATYEHVDQSYYVGMTIDSTAISKILGGGK